MNNLADLLLVVPLVLGVIAGQLAAGSGASMRPGPLTIAVLLAVAGGFALQLAVPGTLELLRRDAAAVGQGQVWRLLTSLFVQDGGLASTLLNLAGLFYAGSIAERIWTRPQWLAIYFGCGLATESVALAWQPVGGGNSIAVFGLCGSMLAVALMPRRPLRARIAGGAGLAAGTALAMLQNIHGAAILFGAAAGALLAFSTRHRQ